MEPHTNLLPYLREIISLLEKRAAREKEILSFQEACEFLKISSSFLYKLTSEHKITFYVPNGKKIYFKKSELIEWVIRHKVDEIKIDGDALFN